MYTHYQDCETLVFIPYVFNLFATKLPCKCYTTKLAAARLHLDPLAVVSYRAHGLLCTDDDPVKNDDENHWIFVPLSGMKKHNIAYGCGRLDAAQSVHDNADACIV